jgi:hypothetical protein
MSRLSIVSLAFLFAAVSTGRCETIACPKQKYPDCQDILPTEQMSCERNFCNAAQAATNNGRVSCVWTCAAHLKSFSVNGVELDSLIETLKKLQNQ